MANDTMIEAERLAKRYGQTQGPGWRGLVGGRRKTSLRHAPGRTARASDRGGPES